MKKSQIVKIDPNILGGTPVFEGTRVPVETLFHHLRKGISTEEFLKDFPSVGKEQVNSLLGMAAEIFESPKIKNVYEDIIGRESS